MTRALHLTHPTSPPSFVRVSGVGSEEPTSDLRAIRRMLYGPSSSWSACGTPSSASGSAGSPADLEEEDTHKTPGGCWCLTPCPIPCDGPSSTPPSESDAKEAASDSGRGDWTEEGDRILRARYRTFDDNWARRSRYEEWLRGR